jgi:hypothetical protein
MRTITIKIESDKDAVLVKRLLAETKFEATVETFEDDDDISDEELQLLEDRLEKYRVNPKSAISLNELKEKMKKKYGF